MPSGWWGHEQAEHRGFLGQWKYSVWYYYNDGYVIIHLSKPTEFTTPRVNTMDFGWLWCVDVGSSLFKKKSTILVSGVGNVGGYACVRTGDMWEISIHFSQFYCKPKTALKKNFF